MLVYLDAGHGGNDVGAVGKFSKESKLTLDIALLVRQKLLEKNIEVAMTRVQDVYKSLSERCEKANKERAQAFVSIHINSAENQQASGFEIFCYRLTNNGILTQAYKLAKNIESKYLEHVREIKISRGIKQADFYVLKNTIMPAVLVECGFISNEEEEKVLNKLETQSAIAKAIAEGTELFLKGVNK